MITSENAQEMTIETKMVENQFSSNTYNSPLNYAFQEDNVSKIEAKIEEKVNMENPLEMKIEESVGSLNEGNNNSEIEDKISVPLMGQVRKATLNSVIDTLMRIRRENEENIQQQFDKIGRVRKEILRDESFFCRHPSLMTPERRKMTMFINSLKEKNLVYNLKSSFPIEKKYFQMMEEYIKVNSNNSVNKMSSESEIKRPFE